MLFKMFLLRHYFFVKTNSKKFWAIFDFISKPDDDRLTSQSKLLCMGLQLFIVTCVFIWYTCITCNDIYCNMIVILILRTHVIVCSYAWLVLVIGNFLLPFMKRPTFVFFVYKQQVKANSFLKTLLYFNNFKLAT